MVQNVQHVYSHRNTICCKDRKFEIDEMSVRLDVWRDEIYYVSNLLYLTKCMSSTKPQGLFT